MFGSEVENRKKDKSRTDQPTEKEDGRAYGSARDITTEGCPSDVTTDHQESIQRSPRRTSIASTSKPVEASFAAQKTCYTIAEDSKTEELRHTYPIRQGEPRA